MVLRWNELSVKPLINKDFAVQVSSSLYLTAMGKSWENEVRLRSKFPNICNFPIAMENSIVLLAHLIVSASD